MNIQEIVSKWEGTKLLEGVYSKENMAMCLEAQRQFNETHEQPEDFKRCSIPVVFRTFCSKGRNHFVNHFDEQTQVFGHMLKTKFVLPCRFDQDGNKRSTDDEAEYVAKTSVELKEEIKKLFKDRFENQIGFHGFSCNESGNLTLFWS